MPANGDDLLAAQHIVELGFPTVRPVMSDMVKWMRVAHSPVADTFADFFGRLGTPALSAIEKGIFPENCWLRHQVFTRVLPLWSSDAIRALTHTLTMIATQPDAYNNDLRSAAMLAKHSLADKQWLADWLGFKRDRLAERNELLHQIEAELKRKG